MNLIKHEKQKLFLSLVIRRNRQTGCVLFLYVCSNAYYERMSIK